MTPFTQDITQAYIQSTHSFHTNLYIQAPIDMGVAQNIVVQELLTPAGQYLWWSTDVRY